MSEERTKRLSMRRGEGKVDECERRIEGEKERFIYRHLRQLSSACEHIHLTRSANPIRICDRDEKRREERENVTRKALYLPKSNFPVQVKDVTDP